MLSISVILTVIFAAIFGALFGLAKGFKKSVLRLITVVIAAILTYITTPWLAELFLGKDHIVSIVGAFGITNEYNELVKAIPAAEELIYSLCLAFVSTVVFLILFHVFKCLMRIPYLILGNTMEIFKEKDGSEKEPMKRRVLGMPIGAVQGIVTVLVPLFVIAGLVSLSDNVVGTVLNDKSGNLSETQVSLEYAEDIIEDIKSDPIMNLLCTEAETVESYEVVSNESENAGIKVTTKIQGRNNFVFERITKLSINGKEVSLTEEAVAITQTYIQIVPLISTGNEGFSEKEIAALEGFADTFGNSYILTEIGSDLVSGACEKWANGEKFIGVAFESIDEKIDPIVFALFGTLKDSTSETLSEDLDSLVEILKIFDKHELLSDLSDESIIKNLNGDFIYELLTVLSENERFNVVIPEVTNLSIRIVAEALNIEDVSGMLMEPGHCKLTEEDIRNISDGFDKMIDFVNSFTSLEGGFSIDKIGELDITAVGQALDSLKKTPLFENSVDALASAVVVEIFGSSSDDFEDVLADIDMSYEEMMETVQITAGVFSNMQDLDASDEEKNQSVSDLLENINPDNAEVLIAAVDESFVSNIAGAEENADKYVDLLTVGLSEMAKLEDDMREKEADKVQVLFDMVSNPDKAAYGEDGIFKTVDEIISVGVESVVVSNVIQEITSDESGNTIEDPMGFASTITDEDKAHISEELYRYYEEMASEGSYEEAEELMVSIQALSALLGLGMEINN